MFVSGRFVYLNLEMAWKNEVTLKFLDIYQKEPIIWDPSHKQHKSRNDVYDAWKRIQTEFSSISE